MRHSRFLGLGAAAMLVASVTSTASLASSSSAASRLSLFGAAAGGVCTPRAGLEGLYRTVDGQSYRCTNRDGNWLGQAGGTPCVARPGEDGAWRQDSSNGVAGWARCGGVGSLAWLAAVVGAGGLAAALASGSKSP